MRAEIMTVRQVERSVRQRIGTVLRRAVLLGGAALAQPGLVPAALAQPGAPGEPMRVETTGGRFWQGRIVSETPREVVVQTATGQLTIPRESIRRMVPVAAAGASPGRAAGAQPAAAVAPAARLRPQERVGTLRLSGESALGTQLFPALFADYGQEVGLDSLREDVAADPAERVFELLGPETSRGMRAEMRVHGAVRAFADLAAGRTDIALAARRVSEAEARALQAAGAGNPRQPGLEQVVALSGIAIVVHRDNAVKQVSLERLRDVLAGNASRWSDLGGPPLPITVYALADDTDAAETVRERVLGPLARITSRARRFDSQEDLADALAADPGGIGFVNVVHTRNTRALRLQASCGLIFEASPFQMRAEEYPLAQRMYFYGTTRTAPLGRDFLAYAVGDRAQAVTAKAGFTNLSPLLASEEESKAQLAAAGEALPADIRAVAGGEVTQFRRLVAAARRLSITFRFEAGRTDLDARAEADLARLARWTQEPANAGKALMLIGHASVDGAYASNLSLSRARAQSVANRMGALGVAVASVDSVGPVSPVACASAGGEGDINRRVEVWVK
jgi:phosphate transport system substrate-binding protein